MPLLDGDLQNIFGAALGAVYLDGVLHKIVASDTGAGGFSTATTDHPVKAMVEAVSDRARAASGLPLPSVSISVLRAGLPVSVDLDDLVTVSGRTYRVIRADTDAAGAAFSLIAVPD